MAQPLSWGIFWDFSGLGSSERDLRMIKGTELWADAVTVSLQRFELGVVKGKLRLYLGASSCGKSRNPQITVC